MARKFVKDREGQNVLTLPDNRKLAFQVAETVSLELGIDAVVTRVKNPETGGMALGMYLSGGKRDVTPEEIETAASIWRKYLGESCI